jgi:hypothetical protein
LFSFQLSPNLQEVFAEVLLWSKFREGFFVAKALSKSWSMTSDDGKLVRKTVYINKTRWKVKCRRCTGSRDINTKP